MSSQGVIPISSFNERDTAFADNFEKEVEKTQTKQELSISSLNGRNINFSTTFESEALKKQLTWIDILQERIKGIIDVPLNILSAMLALVEISFPYFLCMGCFYVITSIMKCK